MTSTIVCASSSVAAVAVGPSSSSQNIVNNVGAVKASFLAGRTLKTSKISKLVARRVITVSEVAKTDRPVQILRWNVQSKIVHCRWVMLGATGIFIAKLLTKIDIKLKWGQVSLLVASLNHCGSSGPNAAIAGSEW
eukprot:Gb_02585 [translate_table: standard]